MRSCIDRRSFIRRTLAGVAALAAWRAPTAAGRDPAVRTLGEALATGDREVVARFIMASPAKAVAADLRERVVALRLMAHGTASREEVEARLRTRAPEARVAGKGTEACLACQGASHLLVREASGNPDDFQAYVEGVGGRSWLEAALPTFENADLQAEIQRGLRAGARSS
jgi:hypothetical protein